MQAAVKGDLKGGDNWTEGYLDGYEKIHLTDDTRARMPRRWWYDTLLPLLLRILSVSQRGSQPWLESNYEDEHASGQELRIRAVK